MTDHDHDHDFDLESALERSRARVVRAMPDDSPLVQDGRPVCPWCRVPLAVRFSTLGRAGKDPVSGEAEDDRTPFIDGVGFKHAGDGCGFRPNFDVPLREGHGFWPALDGPAEFEREVERRGGDRYRRIDAAYDADRDDEAESVEDRLEALGYL